MLPEGFERLGDRQLYVCAVGQWGIVVLFCILLVVHPLQRYALKIGRNGRILFFVLCHVHILKSGWKAKVCWSVELPKEEFIPSTDFAGARGRAREGLVELSAFRMQPGEAIALDPERLVPSR